MLKCLTLLLFLKSFGISDTKIYVKNYYSNKNLKEEGWLLNDKKTDYWFYYYENGLKKEEGHYNNNQKTNWWVFYDEKQIVTKKCEFKNNKLNGLTIVYSQGEIAKGEKYSNGKKVKTWTNLVEFKIDNSNF